MAIVRARNGSPPWASVRRTVPRVSAIETARRVSVAGSIANGASSFVSTREHPGMMQENRRIVRDQAIEDRLLIVGATGTVRRASVSSHGDP